MSDAPRPHPPIMKAEMTTRNGLKTRAREIQKATGVPYCVARGQAMDEAGFAAQSSAAPGRPGLSGDDAVQYVVEHSGAGADLDD